MPPALGPGDFLSHYSICYSENPFKICNPLMFKVNERITKARLLVLVRNEHYLVYVKLKNSYNVF